MLKRLMEQIQKYEDSLVSQNELIERLEKRLADLEKSRQENFDIVAGNNSDNAARRRLDEDDQKIAELRHEIGNEKRRAKGRLKTLRTRILQTQERALETLNQTVQEKQREQNELKEHLIPEAENKLSALQEQYARAAEETAMARKEIADINQLNQNLLFKE